MAMLRAVALRLGMYILLKAGLVTKLAGSALGQGAPGGSAACRLPSSDLLLCPLGRCRGYYLLPRKPGCLLATRVQEAQQAVL